MPKWVYTTITADPKVLADILNDKNEATFQKLIPMPEGMAKRGTNPKIMTQQEIDACWEKYNNEPKTNFDFGFPTDVGITQEEHDKLMEQYGCVDWRSWSDEYWGTKWDATTDEEYNEGDNYINFRTAWGPAEPVILALSKKHPKEPIHVFWEEEQGFGQVYNIEDGEISIIEEWDLAEFEDVEEVEDYTIYKCTQSGGRYDENQPLYTEGKYYLDQDQDMEFDTLEAAREEAESMSEE